MKRSILMAAGVLAVATLAGCSSAAGSSTTSSSSSSAPLAGMLPAANRTSGVITVASLDDLPPWVSSKNGQHTGIDVDMTDAMGKLLGVTFKYTTYQFPTMIPGLQAGRFDLIINEIGDTTDREKAVSFVDYSQDYSGIIVPSGNPKNLTKLDDLCGLNLAVVQGSFPESQAKAQSAKCTTEGKKAIKLTDVPSPTDTYLAIASGRADATLNGYSTAAYAINQGGVTKGIELAKGDPIQPGLNGFAYNKSNAKLGKAIQAALQKIMDDGTYATILKKYGVSGAAIPKATIDSAAAFAAANPGS